MATQLIVKLYSSDPLKMIEEFICVGDLTKMPRLERLSRTSCESVIRTNGSPTGLCRVSLHAISYSSDIVHCSTLIVPTSAILSFEPGTLKKTKICYYNDSNEK